MMYRKICKMNGDERGYNREKSKERKREMESLERIIEG